MKNYMAIKRDSLNLKPAFITVTSLFFLWGFITVFVDSLIPHLRDVFELSYFQSNMVQFAFFTAYGVISIPAGWVIPKVGYKKGVIIVLITMSLGCLLFWLAADFRVFGLFISGMFVLASGMTFLQVAANPYIAVLGSEENASSRLNLAQAFNSLGTTIAPGLGAILILKDDVKSALDISALAENEKVAYLVHEAQSVQTPFLIIALSILMLAFILKFIKLPQIILNTKNGGYSQVLKDKRLMFGALGIFLYVGAEVAIGTYLVNYFIDMGLAETVRTNSIMRSIAEIWLENIDTINPKGVVGVFVTLYWLGAMIGRFVGSYLTSIYNSAKVLQTFGFCAIVLVIISISTVGLVSMWSILAVGLFNSIMFPTIFTLSIKHLGDLKPQGSGILCTAIAGGAFIPAIFSSTIDNFGFKIALIIPIICYAIILIFGRFTTKDIQSKKLIIN